MFINWEGVTWRFIPRKASWFGGFWGCLVYRPHKSCNKEGTLESTDLLTDPINNYSTSGSLVEWYLTYISHDPQDLNLITLVIWTKSLPYEHHNMDEISDPSYNEYSHLSKDAKSELTVTAIYIEVEEWILNFAQRVYRTSGNNHGVGDDGPYVSWKLAVVEDLVYGGDGLVRAANIRTSTGQTNRSIISHLKYPFMTRIVTVINWIVRMRMLIQQVIVNHTMLVKLVVLWETQQGILLPKRPPQETMLSSVLVTLYRPNIVN